jgi:hypothetical protein
MLNYMKENFGERATNGDRTEIEFFRNEVNRLTHLLVLFFHSKSIIG